jgi:hypothetical protein
MTGEEYKEISCKGKPNSSRDMNEADPETSFHGLSTNLFSTTSLLEYLIFKETDYQILKCYITQQVYRHYTKFSFLIIMYICVSLLAIFFLAGGGRGFNKMLMKTYKPNKGKVRPQKHQLRATRCRRKETKHNKSVL